MLEKLTLLNQFTSPHCRMHEYYDTPLKQKLRQTKHFCLWEALDHLQNWKNGHYKVVLSVVKYGHSSITFYLHQWFATLEAYSNHLGLLSNTLELLEGSPGDSGQPALGIRCFFWIQDAPVEKYLHCAPRGGALGNSIQRDQRVGLRGLSILLVTQPE